MADASVIDYYAVLHVPFDADLAGVENAYARLSDEFATMTDVDETCTEALQRLNEAYSVLSRPELRREYDAVLFARQRADLNRQIRAFHRRRVLMQWTIVGALLLVVVAQAAALVYLGHDQIGDFLAPVLGPLVPGGVG
ncbi:MAG: DnaJ domain-containing protein [Dehalococcoidia bacterium]|nr:DnaJ domain-containing protein [Dehalococcoidia bacterium]